MLKKRMSDGSVITLITDESFRLPYAVYRKEKELNVSEETSASVEQYFAETSCFEDRSVNESDNEYLSRLTVKASTINAFGGK